MGRLFWKIFLAFWLALVVAAVSTGTVVWLQHGAADAAPKEFVAGPRGGMDMAAAMLRDDGVEALRGWMQHRRHPAPIYVVDEAGRDVLGRPVPEAARARAREIVRRRGESFRARSVVSPGGERYLLFAPPMPGMRLPPRPLLQPWQLIAIGLLTSLVFSAALAWYLARPIRSLRSAFDGVAAGRLETRVSPKIGSRRDEIADLGRDFDRMAGRLQSLIDAQRRLLHDVSHELRSPLARLHAAIGLARQDPQKLEPSFERIEREAARLDELVGEVLTLARLEGGTASGPEETVDLADLVADIAEDARFEAQAAGREVALDSAEQVLVRGRAELLHRAVENVVRNAVKHTLPGTTVEMKLSSAGGRALLGVVDRGPGIAPGEAERIFEPFYRGAAAPGGFGLGLAIAQRAVVAHGGTIRAENAEGGGLRVEIELPLAKVAEARA
ncbi:MAG: HAMP domain-containing protein [Betaproteobacteria bacterium]|nr:MAG: HAMP domain-containing protein [Betaproteobacteria bacterium]